MWWIFQVKIPQKSQPIKPLLLFSIQAANTFFMKVNLYLQLTLAIVLVSFAHLLNAQTYCIADRFRQVDFFPPSGILVDLNVMYGSAINWEDNEVALLADVYMPDPVIDPLAERPLIVMVHSGSWQGGSKSKMEADARYYAGLGYVVAAIDYRIGWDWDNANPACTGDSLGYAKARHRAIQDLRAALRYFSHHADDFGVDPSHFFLYGGSAGAGVIMETQFLTPTEFETLFGMDLVNELGGADATGNAYTDTYAIVGSHTSSPSMTDTSFIGPDDTIPGIYFHGTADQLVLYTEGARGGCASQEYGYMYGSRRITEQLAQLGICYELNSEVGAPHGALYNAAYRNSHTACFFKHILCDDCMTNEFEQSLPPCVLSPPQGEVQKTGDLEMSALNLQVFPIPAVDYLNVAGSFQDEGVVKLRLSNLVGQIVWQKNISTQEAGQFEIRIPVKGLGSGIYLLSLEQNGQVEVIRVAIGKS